MDADKPSREFQESPEFIENLKELNSDAWYLLKTHYARRLNTFILGALIEADLSRISVQDVEQDVWITAIRKIKGFHWQGQGLLYNWLRSIATNVVRNHVKTYRHSLSLSQSDSVVDGLPAIAPPEDPKSESVEHQVESIEKALRSELECIGINPKHIEIYLLRKVQDLKPREIGKRLNMPARSVSTNLSRVERALTNFRKSRE
jgi:RNA polymerase sigma factor (sigma-70 family)